MQLFLYVGSYKNVDVEDWYEARFLKDVLSLTYEINEDAGGMHSLNYT